MTQAEKILRHLRDLGSIDPHTALRDYSCMRLAARIGELREAGHLIVREMVEDRNRFGEPVRYARYMLADGYEIPRTNGVLPAITELATWGVR